MGGRRVEKQCFELPKKSYLHLQVIFLQFVSQIFEFCEIRLFLKVIFKHFKNLVSHEKLWSCLDTTSYIIWKFKLNYFIQNW